MLSVCHLCCRRVLYGDNTIAVHVTPVIKLLFTQVCLNVKSRTAFFL